MRSAEKHKYCARAPYSKPINEIALHALSKNHKVVIGPPSSIASATHCDSAVKIAEDRITCVPADCGEFLNGGVPGERTAASRPSARRRAWRCSHGELPELARHSRRGSGRRETWCPAAADVSNLRVSPCLASVVGAPAALRGTYPDCASCRLDVDCRVGLEPTRPTGAPRRRQLPAEPLDRGGWRPDAHDGAATPPELATICCFSSALATTFVTSSIAELIELGATVLLSPDHASLLSANE